MYLNNYWPLMLVMLPCYTMMMMSESKMMMWIMMELGSIIFILMISSNKQTEPSAIPSILMTQITSSMMMLMGIILPKLNVLMTIGLMFKLSFFPFHNWLPMVSYKMSWMDLMMMLTIQEVPPMMFIPLVEDVDLFITSFSFSAMIMPMKASFSSSLKPLLSMSSIIHSSWMSMCMIQSPSTWMMYMMMYSLLTSIMCINMNMKESIKYTTNNNYYKEELMSIMYMMIMLMALPPSSMMMIKMISMELTNKSIFTSMLMLSISSSMSLMFYSRMMYKSMYLSMPQLKPIIPESKMMLMNIMMFLFMMMLIM